jgi:excisionase family DNA binding protein
VEVLRQTYLPENEPELAQVHDVIEAHERANRGATTPRYFLSGADSTTRAEVPAEVHKLIRHVVTTFRQGHAVTLTLIPPTVTVQEAADLLGVRRTTVIGLLDEGTLPYERVGTHRRVLTRDLLAHREHRRTEQYAALEETGIDIDDEDDPETALGDLRETQSDQ